jgi:hypothetical protein
MSQMNDEPEAGPSRAREGALEGASLRQALWSGVAVLAMVFVLFVVFYGINAERGPSTAARSTPPGQTASPPSSLASTPDTPSTTGQGQSQGGQIGDR